MADFLQYETTILIAGLTGIMLLVQIVVADILSIKSKHTPGYPIDPDHGSFLFRASRAYNNTNETIAAFALVAFFAVFSGADPGYLNGFAIVYFIGRIAHMLCYYAKLSVPRSVAFALSLVGIVGMFVSAWL